MQRRAAEESLTDHGKDNSNGRAHVGDAIRHKPGILGFLRQIGFMGATGAAEYLREMLPYLSAKQEPAISAVKMISGGPPKEVLDGERIALVRIAKDGN